MTAQNLIDILARNNKHYIVLTHPCDESVYEIIHLEDNRFDGTQLRFWFFDENGDLTSISNTPAPNGEMDLLAEYTDDLDTYGYGDEACLKVTWC